MGDLTHADLQALGGQITEAFRHEVSVLRGETQRMERGIYRRIDELRIAQDRQNGRVAKAETEITTLHAYRLTDTDRLNDHESDIRAHGEALTRIDERTKNVSPTLGLSLSRKQKAALWAAFVPLTGAVLDLLRHVVLMLLALLSKGAKP